MRKAIIGVVSSNPVTINLDTNTEWEVMDVVSIPTVEGSFEVRKVETKGQDKTYLVMPMS